MAMLDQISKKVFQPEFTVSRGVEIGGKKEKRVVTVNLTPLPLQIDEAAELCGGLEYLIGFAQLGRRNQCIVDGRALLNASDDAAKQMKAVIKNLKMIDDSLTDEMIAQILGSSETLQAKITESEDVELAISHDGNSVSLPGKKEDTEDSSTDESSADASSE